MERIFFAASGIEVQGEFVLLCEEHMAMGTLQWLDCSEKVVLW